MTSKLHISTSPHIHHKRSTASIMLNVILALLPTTIAGILIFGLRAAAVIAVCVATCIISEFLFNIIIKKEQTISDFSAAVTGLILALNLPANIPFWQAIVGSVFAIIIVKAIFGGLGKNLVNPAITARVFMILSFGAMASIANPIADTTSSATPLTNIAEGNPPELIDLFLGKHGGSIGEVCSLALLLGGIYLIATKIISWHIPVSFIGATFILSLLFNGFDFYSATALVLSGGLFIGAVFMATEYVTSPTTKAGKIFFGVGAAFITVIIRIYGNYPEGVSFAILFMNILTPYIDVWTRRKLFGGKKREKTN